MAVQSNCDITLPLNVSCRRNRLNTRHTFVFLVRCLKDGPTRRALAIGCSLQIFQQATGINTLMYYTATIVSMAGIGAGAARTAIWTSAVITALYLVACGLGVLLVERLGRRRLLLTSLVGMSTMLNG